MFFCLELIEKLVIGLVVGCIILWGEMRDAVLGMNWGQLRMGFFRRKDEKNGLGLKNDIGIFGERIQTLYSNGLYVFFVYIFLKVRNLVRTFIRLKY